jgi:hypothetical protein
MKTKLTILREYIDKQADDYNLWFRSEKTTEKYLQEELRRVAWLIEDASIEQIHQEIKKYEARL